MINYWSFTNNVKDSIGTAHLYNGVNVFLTNDRFGNDNSSLRLNSGFYCVPSGVYFNGPFTTSAWVNAKSYGFSSRVFDFGKGQAIDNIIFGLFKENSTKSFFQTYSGNTYTSILYCNSAIVLNEWIHVAVTFDGSQAKFYFNGIFSGSSPQSSPQNVVRQTNFIGKSNWSFYGDALANAIYDELRIYNRVLTQNEIYSLMYF